MKKFAAILLTSTIAAAALAADGAVDIGNRRELFLDSLLIDKLENSRLVLHHPTPREIVMRYDQPHEGNVSCYTTIFKDGDRYRMYYNGAHYTQHGIIGTARKQHPEFTCYAESTDGIHWTRPVIGAVEYNGSKENNILNIPNRWTHCFTPFKDANPACPPDEQYKAVAFDHGTPGKLFAFKSPDGINWSPLSDQPILTEGRFDSQNLAFYDPERGCYVAYFRNTREGGNRDIMTAESKDFRNWTKPRFLNYSLDTQPRHFYTNAIIRYPRAPQYLLGFPMRFSDHRSHSCNLLAGVGDGGLIVSRDGENFVSYPEAFVRPGLNPERWFNRCNYAAWGIAETTADSPGNLPELSFYYSEGYAEGREVALRRFTLRPDGFVSVQADDAGGIMVTRPLTFAAIPETEAKPVPARPAHFTDLTIDRNPKVRHFGSYALRFSKPGVLEIPETRELGDAATFAATIDVLSRGGERRLFSAFDKQPVNGRKLFCFHIYLDPKNPEYSLIRCMYSPLGKAELKGPEFEKIIASKRDHHFAATIQNGKIKLYIDGEMVAEGGNGKAVPMEFTLGNLRFGNDYPPNGFFNSPFIGFADDVLVLRRALSGEEIAALAANGAAATLDLKNEPGILYTMEKPAPDRLYDELAADGCQDAHFPMTEPQGRTRLLLNCSTSALGSIRVELRDADNQPLPGYTFADCDEIYDDSLSCPVSWRGNAELSQFAGKPIRLAFELKDADLYAFEFGR